MTDQTPAAQTTKPKSPRRDTTRMSAACALAAKHPTLAAEFLKTIALPSGGRHKAADDACTAAENAHAAKMRDLRAVRAFAYEVDTLDGAMLGGVKGAVDLRQR